METVELVRVVSKEISSPTCYPFLGGNPRRASCLWFRKGKTSSLERLRLGAGAEDEDSIAQTLGNPALGGVSPPFIIVEVDPPVKSFDFTKSPTRFVPRAIL
jgi:hypothetical protein